MKSLTRDAWSSNNCNVFRYISAGVAHEPGRALILRLLVQVRVVVRMASPWRDHRDFLKLRLEK